MSKFKVGDKVKRIRGCNDHFNEGETGIIECIDCEWCIVRLNKNGYLSCGNEVVNLELVESEKLINEQTMENLESFDKKALSDAKKEIAIERAETQKEKAKAILRGIMKDKDEAEEVIKLATEELEEIDENLKVFNKK